MTVVKLNPIKLPGPWVEGYALDLYSISSTFLGYDGSIPRFDTKYTEVGELVNRLKYRGDSAALPSLIDTAEEFVKGLNWTFDCVVAVPPSITRKSQPVAEIARELASRFGVPVCDKAVIKTKATPPMKAIDFPVDRANMLQNAFRGEPNEVRAKRLLLLDDLFEYGSTVGAVTNVLLTEGKAAAVYLLALTRKRT
jgi:predicted amidophosphoribosyltransferase